MSDGLGDRVIDLGGRAPIQRDETPRAIEPIPIFLNPNLPLTSSPPQVSPRPDISANGSIDGFYLGDFFIPFWLPIAAIGLWLFLSKR